MKNSMILFILIAMIGSQFSYGQSSSALQKGGLGYVSIGGGVLQFSNLQSNLNTSILCGEDLNNTSLSLGGGGFLLLGAKVIVMGQGYGGLISEFSKAQTTVERTYGGGGINVGYALYNKNHFLIFPSIGVGGNLVQMEYNNQRSSEQFFGGTTIPSSSSKEFGLNSGYLDLNLNAHKIIDIGEDDDIGGISLGLSVGYQYGLKHVFWEEEVKEQVTGIQSERLNGFYLKLLIGGGGFTSAN